MDKGVTFFARGVYGTLLLLFIAAAFNGNGFFGVERYSFPSRVDSSIASNLLFWLSYQPRFWPLVLAVAIGTSFFALLGRLYFLSKPLLYLSSLMLFFSTYAEIDPAWTFFLYAQGLLFFHAEEDTKWAKWLSSMGGIVVPMGLAMYVLFFALSTSTIHLSQGTVWWQKAYTAVSGAEGGSLGIAVVAYAFPLGLMLVGVSFYWKKARKASVWVCLLLATLAAMVLKMMSIAIILLLLALYLVGLRRKKTQAG